MKSVLSLVVAAGLACATPTLASLVDLEYTLTRNDPTDGGAATFSYDFQLIVDLDDPDYVDGMGFERILVGGAFIGDPRPFESTWLTPPGGWGTNVQVGRLSGTFLQFGDDIAAPYWVPDAGDRSLRFSGLTENADPGPILWSYVGYTDVDDPRSIFLFLDPFVARQVSALTDLDPTDPGPSPVPLPAGLPLLLAGLAAFAGCRRLSARRAT